MTTKLFDFMLAALLSVMLSILLVSCSLSPLRVFQAKVPPPIVKPPEQVEKERRAADLLARKIETPKELIPVAGALSESLGKPEKPIVADTPAQLIKAADTSTEELRASLVLMQHQLADLNKKLMTYQGKEIEGTGLSLLGPGMTVVVIGLIALAVLCPPALTLMIFAFKRLKAAAGIVVNEVEAASKDPTTQAAVAQIKENISEAMVAHPGKTTLLKDVITNLKTA